MQTTRINGRPEPKGIGGYFRVPDGASRVIRYGDRIYVRLVNVERGWTPIAEFELRNVSDMTEVYSELRKRTSGERCLTRLYVRNATRGWSFEQPFKLYGTPHRVPAASVTRPVTQPARRPFAAAAQTGRREIPEGVRMLYGIG